MKNTTIVLWCIAALGALSFGALAFAQPSGGAAPPGAVRTMQGSQETAAVATQQARRLFDEYWEWMLREFPILATFVGDHRYDDRFTDYSEKGIARRKAGIADFARRLRAIDRAALSGQDAVSYDVLATTLALEMRRQAAFDRDGARGADLWVEITPLGGPQLGLPDLVLFSRFANVADYENYIARLSAAPRLIDELVAGLRRAVARGWLPPAEAAQRIPAQIDMLLEADLAKNSLYAPFARFPADVPEAERQRLSAQARSALTEKTQPAFRALRKFYVEEYLPACKTSPGARAQPGFAEYYAAKVAEETTTNATPEELHRLGLREVERIVRAMEAVIASTGFKGTRSEFVAWMESSPRFYYDSAEELLAGYRQIASRVDAGLPRLFGQLPRRPYGIRAMPAAEGDNAERYIASDAAGTRPGYFEANVVNLHHRPKGEMVAVFLHEAVPGHHFQIARAQELEGVPAFRKFGLINAYTEGWGLYAESLGEELGLYEDPYARFGYLTLEIWRAARLVVDTGIHAYGWSRERAIRYMRDTAGFGDAVAAAEVDRYFTLPAQALAYKVGQLRILALREKARAALGERFDLRRFHDAVLENGGLPLSILEKRIGEWIERTMREPVRNQGAVSR